MHVDVAVKFKGEPGSRDPNPWFEMDLPVVPRVGEMVGFGLRSGADNEDLAFVYGVVTDITHMTDRGGVSIIVELEDDETYRNMWDMKKVQGNLTSYDD